MNKFAIWALSVLFAASPSFAADDLFGLGEEDEFDMQTEVNTPEQAKSSGQVLSSFLSSRVPASAARNIEKAEKVFCYTVSYADPQNEGYVLNGMAVKGSCGELSESGIKLFKDTLWSNMTAFSGNMDSCSISPKIMLRYIYGPDSTDVLLSYPCPAVTFYHGREVVTVNAAPGGEIMEKITKAYGSLAEPYVSPALLGQMVANGQVQNQAQKEKVRRLGNAEANLRKWSTETSTNTPKTQTTNKPAQSGWNKLK